MAFLKDELKGFVPAEQAKEIIKTFIEMICM